MESKSLKRTIYEYFECVVAAFIYAVAMRVFINPAEIVPGGVTGIASVISYVTDVNVGLMFFILNLPLLIVAVILLKGDFTAKTVVNSVSNAIFLQVLPESIAYTDSMLLSTVMGGALVGISMHLAYKANGSNGGTEIIARLIHKYKPEKDVSGLILILNTVIVFGGSIFLMFNGGVVLTVVYSLIYTYLSGWFMGFLGRGHGDIVRFFIITSKPDVIREKVASTFSHGFTCLDVYGRGGVKRSGIVVIIKRRKESAMRKIIAQSDKEAFVIVKQVYDVIVGGKFSQSE